MTKESFEAGMAVFTATFRDISITPTNLNAWWSLLKDMPDNDFTRAIMSICRSEKQIYPGTNIVALILDRARGDVQSQSLRALLLTERAMFEVGAYKSPRFEDPIINCVVSRLGGWEHVCLMDLDEWKFVRKDFERIYQDMAKHGVPAEIPNLTGTLDRCNAITGHGSDNIVQIGEKRRKELT